MTIVWVFDPAPFKAARERLGLTPAQFGRRLQPPMGSRQIRDVEDRRVGMTVRSLLKFCEVFELDPRTLFRNDLSRRGPARRRA